MNIQGIEKDSLLNGDGIRVVLWVSGCTHNCKGCHNPETHDFKSGYPYTPEHFMMLMEEMQKDYVSGLTFLGGEPLDKRNIEEVTNIAKNLKSLFPHKTIWVYTGFTWEYIRDLEIMKYIDVLVDGRFVQELADTKYPWAGSTNQRVIMVQKSLGRKEVVLWQNEECFRKQL